jgi:hypothetical protein
MNTPLHDKDGFFKYYTADSATLTLKNTSRKWSTPALFNDPFDNQFDLYLEEPSNDLIEKQINQFHEIITSPKPLKADQFGGGMTPWVEYLRQAHLRNPDFKYTEDQMAYRREGVIEGMRRAIHITPETNAEIRRIMADTTIFCLSETPDNLLMWSHYAQNHTGAVIKFLSLPEVDSPIILAQPVRYTTQIPRRTFANLMDLDKARKEVIDIITLTKSEVWAYEKEWRIITGLWNKTQSYEVLQFAPEEVGAVYLGCKIAKNNKEEIIEVTSHKYSKAKIFQAEKHDREFALIFREIM